MKILPLSLLLFLFAFLNEIRRTLLLKVSLLALDKTLDVICLLSNFQFEKICFRVEFHLLFLFLRL